MTVDAKHLVTHMKQNMRISWRWLFPKSQQTFNKGVENLFPPKSSFKVKSKARNMVQRPFLVLSSYPCTLWPRPCFKHTLAFSLTNCCSSTSALCVFIPSLHPGMKYLSFSYLPSKFLLIFQDFTQESLVLSYFLQGPQGKSTTSSIR